MSATTATKKKASDILARALWESSARKQLGRALRETGQSLRYNGGIEIISRHRSVMNFGNAYPFVTHDTFIAPNASVIGNVTNWDQSSVWYNAVVRADQKHPITIGFNSSVGEGSVITTLPESVKVMDSGLPPEVIIGHFVTIGSGCILKSCIIDDLVDIGDKCVIMDGAFIENHVILEPGTVVAKNQRIPSGQKWGGNPAKFIAPLTLNELGHIQPMAEEIHHLALEHLVELLPYGYSYVQLEELEQQQQSGPATTK